VRSDVHRPSDGRRNDGSEASQGYDGGVIDDADDADAQHQDAQHQDDRICYAQQDEREAPRILESRARDASQQEGIE